MEDKIVNGIIEFIFGGKLLAIAIIASLIYTLYNSL